MQAHRRKFMLVFRGGPVARDDLSPSEPGKDLIKYGTSRLDDLPLREGLLDELHLWYVPVVVGAGQRLFEDVDTSSLDLRLTGERRLGNGSVMLSFAVGSR